MYEDKRMSQAFSDILMNMMKEDGDIIQEYQKGLNCIT